MRKTAKPTPADVTHADLVCGLPPLVPLAEVARHCSVSTRTVRRWIEDGRVRRLRTSRGRGGRGLIPREDLARLLGEMVEIRPDLG